MRELYFGDNLDILRAALPSESVDLVYLDPPFNSQRSYNLLFSKWASRGDGRAPPLDSQHPPEPPEPPDAPVKVFDDTWHWSDSAERQFDEIIHGSHLGAANALDALRKLLGESPQMAYLAMMAPRLVELHRVMASTASLYLHCDGSASHYLKVLLDAVFGAANFRNEIIWHYYNKYSAGKRSFGRNFDQILFYTKSDRYTFHPLREARPKPQRQLLRENVNGVLKNKKGPDGKVIYREVTDKKVDAVWRMACLQPAAKEMLGYPTQKPLALLERIVTASSNSGDLVLDPFCGCGTTLHAAENLGRSWIGVDLSHLAVGVTESRLRAAFPAVTIPSGSPAIHTSPVKQAAVIAPHLSQRPFSRAANG